MTERESVHSINGRIGALESWAPLTKAERRRRTEAGREGLLARFAREADPEGRLPEAERLRAAEDLRRAHMIRIAKASVKARTRGANERSKK